jgi:alkanesulfonate monooxygenase SsuD/methylene tetrahydromethanopterin reductase-like flavin-dependent oxidoreductase (luciferase family)
MTHGAPASTTSAGVELGFFPEPRADDLDALLRRVRYADEAGLDLVGIQDHPYQRRFVDTFALLAFLAARTARVRLFPDVANLPLREAATLAKQAATIDLLSHGRFELGLGAGGMWEAIEGIGGPRRTPGEALAALSESIDVIRALWSTERGLRVPGQHYRLAGAHGGPAPAHDMGIWVGGYGDRMMRLIGQKADGWVPSMAYLPPSALAAKSRLLDDAALAAGRDPAAVRRIYNVGGTIGGTVHEREDAIVGPVSMWVDRLVELVEAYGIDAFVLWAGGDVDAQLELFAEHVAPAVRAQV